MIQEKSGYFELDNGKIYYEIAGSGDTMIFSHAGFVDSRMWDEQWHEFAQQYRVVRFDMRGYGKSSQADAPINRRDDLYRLLKHLDVEKAAFLGCSMSGEIILDFALEHPEMVSALVVVSAIPSGFQLQGAPPRYIMEMIAAVQQGDLALASELQNRIWIDGPFREPEQVNQSIRERAAEMNQIALANETFSKVDMFPLKPLDPPAVQRLNEVDAPTLVIAGKLDHPEVLRAADVMATGIPQTRKAILPDCAHMPNMEQPEMFNQVVLDFLRN